jgi:hypothetical protein
VRCVVSGAYRRALFPPIYSGAAGEVADRIGRTNVFYVISVVAAFVAFVTAGLFGPL